MADDVGNSFLKYTQLINTQNLSNNKNIYKPVMGIRISCENGSLSISLEDLILY